MAGAEELEGICKKITALDPGIRSAVVLNSRGHLEAGGMRKGLEPLEDQRHVEMMYVELALRVRMRHEFDSELGGVRFSMSYRDRVILLSFPLAEDGVLLASTEKDVDFGRIAFEILEIIGPLHGSDGAPRP
ncbi:conserved hypothetical protein [Cenarchaeum symbiosum A]|uniref:Roadblock/LAMTOR2 domain-containing protein n=1 Tax=Cenarchaeum symbiosum (strain A) TaxID=414004 RepID=A0RX87_CENSY|nr:conserved hypothetical protein [Cenarchaeum symbiosum A]